MLRYLCDKNDTIPRDPCNFSLSFFPRRDFVSLSLSLCLERSINPIRNVLQFIYGIRKKNDRARFFPRRNPEDPIRNGEKCREQKKLRLQKRNVVGRRTKSRFETFERQSERRLSRFYHRSKVHISVRRIRKDPPLYTLVSPLSNQQESSSTRGIETKTRSSFPNFSIALPPDSSEPTLAFKWRGGSAVSETVLAGFTRVGTCERDSKGRGIDRGRKSNFYDVLRGVRNERRLRYPVTMDPARISIYTGLIGFIAAPREDKNTRCALNPLNVEIGDRRGDVKKVGRSRNDDRCIYIYIYIPRDIVIFALVRHSVIVISDSREFSLKWGLK